MNTFLKKSIFYACLSGFFLGLASCSQFSTPELTTSPTAKPEVVTSTAQAPITPSPLIVETNTPFPTLPPTPTQPFLQTPSGERVIVLVASPKGRRGRDVLFFNEQLKLLNTYAINGGIVFTAIKPGGELILGLSPKPFSADLDELLFLNPITGNTRHVTIDKPICTDAGWNETDKKLILVCENSLYTYSESTDAIELVLDCSQDDPLVCDLPSWSRDGATVAFLGATPNSRYRSGLFLIDTTLCLQQSDGCRPGLSGPFAMSTPVGRNSPLQSIPWDIDSNSIWLSADKFGRVSESDLSRFDVDSKTILETFNIPPELNIALSSAEFDPERRELIFFKPNSVTLAIWALGELTLAQEVDLPADYESEYRYVVGVFTAR